jgi:glycosyltransferase involved in cell wall biosynthesis
MKLLVVTPALNEEETIAVVISQIPRDIDGVDQIDIVVVDDGSTDMTANLASEAGASVLFHSGNRGVGAAFQTGVERALEIEADLMVNMDGDGQFSPEDIPTLIQPLLDGEAGMVTASRFIKKDYWPQMTKVKFYGNRCMSALISFLVGKKYHDVSCGFRAYNRDVLLHMNLFGQFTYTQETFLDLSFKGVKILEVPVRVKGTREFGQSRVASNLFNYAIQTGKIILRSFRDYKPMILFGSIALGFFLLASALTVFLGLHYAYTGTFTPHKWAGFAAGLFFGLGSISFITGLLADMLGRVKREQDQILYLLKKNRKNSLESTSLETGSHR